MNFDFWGCGILMEHIQIENIHKPNLYETVADKLEKMILDDTLKVGERLPSEASLAESFGVSRTIIRESLKILKERQLIQVKNGDGARVVKPEPSSLKEVVNRMIQMEAVNLPQIYELRCAIEVSAAGLAAQKATPEQVKRLKQIADSMMDHWDNRQEWVALDLQFHLELSKASDNPLFYYFMKPMSDALSMIFAKGYDAPSAKETSVLLHRQIVDAISRQDSAMAEEKMREHLRFSSRDSSFFG